MSELLNLNLNILVPEDGDCENEDYKCPMLFKMIDDNGKSYQSYCNAFRVELKQYINIGLSTLKCSKCISKASKLS